MDEEFDLAIAQFMSMTNASRAVAEKYLEDAEWNLEDALENFRDTGDEFEMPKVNIHAGDDASKKKKENDYYAGGHSSGIAVQAPESKESFKKDFFEGVRKAGGMSEEEHAAAYKPAVKTFVGQGYKLGDSETSSQALGTPLAQLKQEEVKPVRVVITFWRDGFSVEYGDETPTLRKLEDPANREFLADIKRGVVPRELQALARKQNAEIDVEVSDRHDEEFVPPKKVLKSFSGAGNRLGNVTTPGATMASSSASGSGSASASSSSGAFVKGELPHIDASRPQTKLQIRLGDGTRLVAHFNESHTVADVRKFINASSPQSRPYVLVTPPSKEIGDETLTLAAANLLNAVVIQKYK